jgi:hypothetical protein
MLIERPKGQSTQQSSRWAWASESEQAKEGETEQ